MRNHPIDASLQSIRSPDFPVPEGYRLVPIDVRHRFGTCHYCKLPTFKTFRLSKTGFRYSRIIGAHDDHTYDHKTPKSKGGDNAKRNKVHCCAKCNTAKGDMTYEEFLARNAEARP